MPSIIEAPETDSKIFTAAIWKKHSKPKGSRKASTKGTRKASAKGSTKGSTKGSPKTSPKTSPTGSPSRLILAEGWTQIGAQAFEGAKNLKSIHIPASVQIIHDEAFKSTSLVEVTFAEGSMLKTIGGGVFVFTPDLKSIRIPESVNKIDMGAFSRTASLKKIHIPKLVEILPMAMFMKSPGLREVTFDADSRLKTIQQSAFSEATDLETITIPAGVTQIQDGAFFNTSSLKVITFARHSNIAKIAPDAFEGSGLTTVVISGPDLANLNAARHNSGMPPLSERGNHFYGKDNVDIVSPAHQINALRIITKKPGYIESHSAKIRPSLPEHVTNLVEEIFTGIKPKPHGVAKKSSKGGAHNQRTRKLRSQ